MWDIVTSPENAGIDDFDWRVSLARIDESRAFSVFPGFERHFALFEGAGVDLAINATRQERLSPGDGAISFSGDDDVSVSIGPEPVLALNVMLRRARFGATLHFSHVSAPATLEMPQARGEAEVISLLVIASGETRFGKIGTETLYPQDALLWRNAEPLNIRPNGSVSFWWITIGPMQNRPGRHRPRSG
jgi:hypothetical protein